MATVRARLTPDRDRGRRFGLTVGSAFLVLSGVAWWRGLPWATGFAAAVGGMLVLSALIVPTFLGPVEREWMRLAQVISRVTTPVVMAVMYFGIITPVGLLRRMAERNPLVHSNDGDSFWQTRSPGARRSASMERQF
jgi:hypothetical protein